MSVTQAEPDILELSSQLSTMEGCLLIALHLRASKRAILDFRRLVLDVDLRENLLQIHVEKQDLLALYRTILGGIDLGYLNEGTAQSALLESTRLNRLSHIRNRAPRLFNRGRQKARRFDHVLQLEKQFQQLCQGLLTLFECSAQEDEIRSALRLSRTHMARLKSCAP